MTVTTTTRKRPTDAALQAAREAVIEAARTYCELWGSAQPVQDAVAALQAIEAARAAYPALLVRDGVPSGWDIVSAETELREQLWVPSHELSLHWRDGRYQERERQAHERSCSECGAVGLVYSMYCRHWINPTSCDHLHIQACRTCGYWTGAYE